MSEKYYFPPLVGNVDCRKCEAEDCWCRNKYQRDRRDFTHTSGRCPRLPDRRGFVEPAERKWYAETFMLVHAERGGENSLTLTLTMPGQKRTRRIYQVYGYWYCKIKDDTGCTARQVLNIEDCWTAKDILDRMDAVGADYYIFRCSFAGSTV